MFKYWSFWLTVTVVSTAAEQVGFNANRFAVCFKGSYTPGIQNDCILVSGGTADRGNLSVLTREIPTGSGVHKHLPNLKYAGKCVNVIPLRDSQLSEVSVALFYCVLLLLKKYTDRKESITSHFSLPDWTNWTRQLSPAVSSGNEDIFWIQERQCGTYQCENETDGDVTVAEQSH